MKIKSKSNLLKGLVVLSGAIIAIPSIITTSSCGQSYVDEGEIPVSAFTSNDSGELLIADPTFDLSNFTSVKIPNKVNGKEILSIGAGAFEKCVHLKLIDFSDATKCTTIGKSAFSGKNYKEKIEGLILNNVTKIDSNAFENVSFENLDLQKVTTVGTDAFKNVLINSIEIGLLSTWTSTSFFFKNNFTITAKNSNIYKVLNHLDGSSTIGQTLVPKTVDTVTNIATPGLAWGKINVKRTDYFNSTASSYSLPSFFLANSKITSLNIAGFKVLSANALAQIPLLEDIDLGEEMDTLGEKCFASNPELFKATIGAPAVFGNDLFNNSPKFYLLNTNYQTDLTKITDMSNTAFIGATSGRLNNTFVPLTLVTTASVVQYFQTNGGLGKDWFNGLFDLSQLTSPCLYYTKADNIFLNFDTDRLREAEWKLEVAQVTMNVYADICRVTGTPLETVQNSIGVTLPPYEPAWATDGALWPDKTSKTIGIRIFSKEIAKVFFTGEFSTSINLSHNKEIVKIPFDFFQVKDKKLFMDPNISINDSHNSIELPPITSTFSYSTIDDNLLPYNTRLAIKKFIGPESTTLNNLAIGKAFSELPNLAYLTIKNIHEIGSYAFNKSPLIRWMSIDEKLTKIGDKAFSMAVYVDANIATGNPYIYMDNYNDPTTKESGNALAYKAGVTPPSGFSGLGSGFYKFTKANITITDKKLPGAAFMEAHALTTILIEEEVTILEPGAFSSCNNLKKILTPNVTEIDFSVSASTPYSILPELTTINLGTIKAFPTSTNLLIGSPKLNTLIFEHKTQPTFTGSQWTFSGCASVGTVSNTTTGLAAGILADLKAKFSIPTGWTVK